METQSIDQAGQTNSEQIPNVYCLCVAEVMVVYDKKTTPCVSCGHEPAGERTVSITGPIYEDRFDLELEVPLSCLPDGIHDMDEVVFYVALRRCRKCGCTRSKACAIGCNWVDMYLCSNCARPILGPDGETIGYVERQG